MMTEGTQQSRNEKSSRGSGSFSRTAAILVIMIIIASALLQNISASQYGLEEYWSVQEVTIGDLYLEIRFISSICIFGAVDRLPIKIKMAVTSLPSSSGDFFIEDVRIRGVTPKTAKTEIIDIGLPKDGYLLSPGESIVWKITLLPDYSRKPPLQVHMSIVCVADYSSFMLGTNAIFRDPGSPDAQPLVLERISSSPIEPELEESCWAGVKYYYSIRAHYPTAAGVSSYPAVLVASFTAEHPLSSGDILIELCESLLPLDIEIEGTRMTVSIPLNNGELLDPGYEEILQLKITFSVDLQEQRIDYSFVAVSM